MFGLCYHRNDFSNDCLNCNNGQFSEKRQYFNYINLRINFISGV